jgi:hypothetical protein
MQCTDFIREKMTDKELCSLEYDEEHDDCSNIVAVAFGFSHAFSSFSFLSFHA